MTDPVVRSAVLAAIEAFQTVIEDGGGELMQLMVLATVNGVDPTGVCAGKGLADDAEILAFLLAHAARLAEELGIEMHAFPIVRGQG